MQFPSTKASVHTLANGLTVILESDSSAPVISTQLWVETGSMHEGEFLGAGVSHLLEHMVFKGTESFDGDELSETVQAAGGEWNAYTTFDRTVYYIDGPAQSAETFLKVLTEMVFKPSFPKEEFEKEKDVIRREIDMGLDDPNDRNGRLLYSTVYQFDPRREPVIGHLSLFNKISHADMLRYHRERYTTTNSFLSISGDFDKQELLEKITRLTEDIPRAVAIPIEPSREPTQLGRRVCRETFAVSTTRLTLAWQTPSLEDADSAALDLLGTIIGSGRSSRLYQELREKSGLCHQVGAWAYAPPRVSGMFAINAVVDFEQRDALQERILELVEQLPETDFKEEIPKAVRMTLASQFRTLSTASGRASDLASNWQEARNLDFTRDYVEWISSVTEDDLRRVAKQYLIPQTLTITSLDPEGTADDVRQKTSNTSQENIECSQLSNGLTLVTKSDSRVPMASVCIATLTGLLSEGISNNGINSLLAQLLTKGTTERDSESFALEMDSMGASFRVSVGNNSTLTSASCLAEDTEHTLELLAEMLSQPLLPDDALERERETMLAAISEQEQDPLSVAFRKMRQSLFGDHGYGLHSLGQADSLTSLDRDTLWAHFQKHFTASNSAIAVFGDIQHNEVKQWAEQYFSALPTGCKLEFSSGQTPAPSSHHLVLDKQQAVLVIGFPGASAKDDDGVALELIHDYCTDMAGPLFSKIREELGLAYYVSATQFHGMDQGMFAFYLGTSPEMLSTAKTALLDEIQLIAENGIPESMLETVKTTWLASHALANQKSGALARLSALDCLLGFAPDHHLQTVEKIRNLDAATVKRVAQRFFAANEPVIVTVSPDSTN